MLLIRSLLLFMLLLVVSGCQQPVVEQGKPIVKEMPQDKISTTKTAEIEQEEKVLTLGIEGFTEEVKVNRYVNNWVSLWVDSSLKLEELDEQVDFRRENSSLIFSIQRLSTSLATDKLEQVKNDLDASGYELIDEFSLDHREGKGSIFYSYEQRHSVDIYFFEEKEQNILVRFDIPEELMDRFIHRFEYMFNSIEVL